MNVPSTEPLSKHNPFSPDFAGYPDEPDYAVPFSGDDPIIECEACDPEAGEPAGWPEWTDSERFEPTAEDWADYARHRMEEERLDALRRMEDAEYEARMRYGS